ncbi:MAG: hypothetical protein F4X47_07460, partial [Gammaproteobacteria bacterium]|nr:hypothetical protein [Gammaproteobacteria bacterium]
MSSSADFRPVSMPSRTSSALRRLAAVSLAAALPLSAQNLPRVAPEDYGRWENLGPALLSPHGDWVAYTVSRVDETAELRVRRLSEDSTRVFPWGEAPGFAPDGRWLAWTVGLSPKDT